MKIGLIRHFKVDLYKKPFMTSKEYNTYSKKYDFADVIKNEIVVDKEWDKCYCSTLKRAKITAETVYDGEIIPTDKLVEISSVSLFSTFIPLPYYVWAILNRISWNINHGSRPEGKKVTLQRVNEILDVILKEEDKNILIVSHAGTLYEVEKLLLQKGFTGERFLKAKNGKLYVFEN